VTVVHDADGATGQGPCIDLTEYAIDAYREFGE
jgi:hypothetical protein